MNRDDLTRLKIKELQEIAKGKDIKNIAKYKKDQLIDLILETESSCVPKDEKAVKAENTSETDIEKAQDGDIVYSDPVRRTNLMSGVLEVLADGYGFSIVGCVLVYGDIFSARNDYADGCNDARRYRIAVTVQMGRISAAFGGIRQIACRLE